MLRFTLGAVALLSAALAWAQVPADHAALAGQVRLQWVDQQTTQTALESELRASGRGVSAIVTLQQQAVSGGATSSNAWVNELYVSHDAGAWQFSVGKKIVAWDVGYGFRPNDVVEQELRRTLVYSTPQGRPLLIAEHFNAETAWSWVWVNPTASIDVLGAGERALAARVYRRDGAVDWHGFARVGVHSGASVGAAAAWVASEALELHGSLRVGRNLKQLLAGGTWTHQSQVSLLAEAWRDSTALGTLRSNVFVRATWQHEAWQPALDLLYTPADQGRVLTASVTWQGDRVQVQGGLRAYAGPPNALLLQLPVQRMAFVAGTWTF